MMSFFMTWSVSTGKNKHSKDDCTVKMVSNTDINNIESPKPKKKKRKNWFYAMKTMDNTDNPKAYSPSINEKGLTLAEVEAKNLHSW